MAEKLIIKAFGMVAEEIGQSEIWMDSVSNTQELLAILKERYPGLEGMKFSLAVDKELVSENQKKCFFTFSRFDDDVSLSYRVLLELLSVLELFEEEFWLLLSWLDIFRTKNNNPKNFKILSNSLPILKKILKS